MAGRMGGWRTCKVYGFICGVAEVSGQLAIAGEDISAGQACVLAIIGGKVYAAGEHAGEYVGDAVEQIREGFRVYIKDGEVREDDA